jgi:carbamoyl-phosphate synthase large subunit
MGGPLTVAVTGLHRGENPQPGAAVIRSLRRMFPDIRIVGLSYDPLESALYSHDIDRVDSVYLLPFPMKGPEILLERILYLHKKEQLQILIPCLDSELSNFIAIYPELKRRGIAAMLPTRSALDNRAKENLAEFCRRHSFGGPKTFAANDVNKLARYAEEIGYPVYVKGRYYEAWLVHTLVDLVEKFDSVARIWGLPVLVQEALVGEEFDVLGLADGGEIVGHCAIRKLLRTRTGKGFGGVVINDPEVARLTRQIIKALRWSGPFEIEFLKSLGRPHLLFEINPRFPAWVDFPSQIGCNLPVRLLEMLLREKNPTKLLSCDAGQMFVRHSIDLVGDIAELAKLASDGEYAARPPAFKKMEASA